MPHIKKRNLTCHIIFWILLILITYFAENVVLFDKVDFQRPFSTAEYFLLFLGILILVGYYFYNEYKYNDYKPNVWLTIILIIFGIGGVIGLVLTPNIQNFTTIEIIEGVETLVTKQLVVSTQEKLHSFLFLFVALIGTYLQIVVLPRLVSFKKYLLFILYAIVFVSITSIFISYYLDIESYIHLFNHGLEGYKFPMSFLFNRNMYALMLMLGVFSLYYIIALSPKWYNHIFLIFIVMNMFFTFSKASIGITLVTYIINFIYRMIKTFKKHKVRNFIFLFLIIGAIMFLFFLLPLPAFKNLNFLSNTRNFIFEHFIRLGPGTFSSRTIIWERVSELNRNNYFYFGRGIMIFNKNLLFYTSEITRPPRSEYFSHNGFVEIFGQFGVYGLTIYIAGVVLLAGIILYVAIKNSKIGFPSLLVFVGFLFYTMVETSTLFDPTIEGIVTTSLVALPSLSWLYHKKRTQVNDGILESAEQLVVKHEKESVLTFVKKTSLFTTVLLIFIFLFMISVLERNSLQLINQLLFGVLILFYLISIPLITHQIYKIRIKRKESLFWLLFILNLFIHFGLLLACILFFESRILILSCTLIILLTLLTYLIGKKYKKVNKNHILRTFLYSLVIASSIFFILFPFIYYLKMKLFVLGEIIFLLTTITIPFINKIVNFKYILNNKMLLIFAKNIEYELH